MDLETIRRISLARHLYELAISRLRSNNDLHLFAAVNLLQDSVEAFLIAVSDQVNASVDQNTKFDKYFVLINERIAPKELPFKLKLFRLNRIRVDSKHFGIQPARDECNRLAVSVREFFDEVSSSVLGVMFSTVSAIDLLDGGEVKQFLLNAKSEMESGNYEACATSCRKAIYLEIEKNYDVADHKDGSPKGILAGISDAPFYAKSKDYIAKYVLNPTDFIVRDHSHINQMLLEKGVETTDFWNVWRLTPEVYRFKDGTWIVKHDFDKLDSLVLEDKVDYIFSATIDVILAIHTHRKNIKTSDFKRFNIELVRQNVPVLEKADKDSKVMGSTPPGMTSISTDFRVQGFKGDGPYWHVYHYQAGLLLNGYIHQDEVKE